MTARGRPAPETLRQVLARWEARGRPTQPAIGWSLWSWQAALPRHAEYLASLPNPLDRSGVTAEAAEAAGSPHGALRAFLAAMVWGYGRVGYGPFRTARVLADNPQATDIVMRIADRTRRDGGPAAFEQLTRNRLAGLGVAFATKYLCFCSVGYRSQVEYLMFAGAVSVEAAGSQWADPAAKGQDLPMTSTASPPPDVRAEQVAVLEALDEAEEAFAVLPQSGDPHDAEDFERGLRQSAASLCHTTAPHRHSHHRPHSRNPARPRVAWARSARSAADVRGRSAARECDYVGPEKSCYGVKARRTTERDALGRATSMKPACRYIDSGPWNSPDEPVGRTEASTG